MFGPYPDYRRTDLKWFEHLPDSWAILRTKQMFRLVIEKAPVNNKMELLSVYTHIGVRPRKSLEQRGNKASTTDGYWVVKEGDIICNKLLAWMGAIGVSHYQGVTSPAYDILRPIKSCNTDYYHFLFRTKKYLQQFKIRSRGIMDMRLRLYFDQFGQIPIPVPPRHEQDQIVAYLRVQDGHIARFIKAKRDLIKLLTEQKLRIIDHAVTRGLDPNVRLKPSGIEWLGPVPEHWQIHRVKEISHVVMGQSPLSSDCNHQGVGLPFLQGCAEFGVTVPKAFQFCPTASKKAPVNSILMSVRAPVGKMNMADQMYGIGRGLCSIAPKNAVWLTDFARFALESAAGQLKYLTTGSTFDAVSKADVRNMTICLPPVTEQERITRYLVIETKNVDDAIHRANDEIQLIREYRDRLIADVVTGQVDVRGWQPGPEDVVDDTALAALGDDSEDVTEEEDGDGED